MVYIRKQRVLKQRSARKILWIPCRNNPDVLIWMQWRKLEEKKMLYVFSMYPFEYLKDFSQILILQFSSFPRKYLKIILEISTSLK